MVSNLFLAETVKNNCPTDYAKNTLFILKNFLITLLTQN